MEENVIEGMVHRDPHVYNYSISSGEVKLYQQGWLSQEAIQKVAKADPKNIQEVAASQLTIVNNYYQSGLQQSQQSFRWSLIWGGVGFGFLIIAVGVLLFQHALDVAVVSGLAGALVEMFAGIYLYLYRHASDQLAAFRSSLENTQRLLLANSMCERLEGEREQTTRAEIISLIVKSAVELPVPSAEERERAGRERGEEVR